MSDRHRHHLIARSQLARELGRAPSRADLAPFDAGYDAAIAEKAEAVKKRGVRLEERAHDFIICPLSGRWFRAQELMLPDHLLSEEERLQTVDMLRRGGWAIRSSGATGRPVGRPPKLQSEEAFWEAVWAAFQDDPKALTAFRALSRELLAEAQRRRDRVTGEWRLTRPQSTKLRKAILRQIAGQDVNTAAAAAALVYRDRATVRKHLREVRTPNPTNEEMQVIEHIDARLDRIEAELKAVRREQREGFEATGLEIVRAFHVFATGETPIAAWERVLGEESA